MRTLAALLLFVLPAVGSGADKPEDVVKAFYAVCLRARPLGLPNDREMRPLTPFLSAGLSRLFEEARRYQGEFSKKHKGDKPPLADGDLFSSLFEGPTGVEVGTAEAMADGRSKVSVKFTRDDPSSPGGVVRWTDAVVVLHEKGRFAIDDVLFLGDWPFKTGEQLSAVLKSRD